MRFISMKHFRSPEAVKRCALGRETIVLGQIIGEVNGTIRKTNRLQDGTETSSDVLLGDFAGVCYETQGKLVSAGKDPNEAELSAEAVYMPKWFAEAVAAKLKVNPRIEFAVEILVMPTPEGSPILYQYDVRSLIARPANSPVERMKRVLQQAGNLRLSPPQAASSVPLTLSENGTPHDAETGEITDAAEGGEQFPEPGPDDGMDSPIPGDGVTTTNAKPSAKSHAKK